MADLAGGPRLETDLAVCRWADGGWTDPEPSSGWGRVCTGVRASGALGVGVVGL